jgi:hypothetical protein
MKVNRHEDAKTFADRVMPMLMREEAINNWMVGLLTDLCTGARKIPPEQLLLLEVQDDRGEPVAAAASTGEALVLTRMDGNSLAALADFLEDQKIALAKTAGPAETVGAFAALWQRRAGVQAVASLRMMIMQLERLARSYSLCGALRLADARDLETVTPWARGFCEELGIDLIANPSHDVRTRIERKRLHLWCDPHPVSMAATAGPTPNGIRINFVYTPKELRGRGYARACVAELTRAMLESGRKFVFLFVDAKNPTTNRLYREIGYVPIADWEDWRFKTPVGNSV